MQPRFLFLFINGKEIAPPAMRLKKKNYSITSQFVSGDGEKRRIVPMNFEIATARSYQGLAMTYKGNGDGLVQRAVALLSTTDGLSLSPLKEFNKSSVKNKKLFEAQRVLFV